MTLDELFEMWQKDSVIDANRLDDTTIRTASMHAKYLELFCKQKLILKRKNHALESLKKDKWLWLSGKMTKEEIDERGWAYDPFKGAAKPLKSDLDRFIDTDTDIMKLESIVEYEKTMLSALEEIMNAIRWRHTNIKNIIDFKRFEAGN